MKATKNVIILGVNPYSGNRGVGALAYSVMSVLDKISKENDVQINIYLVGKSKHIVENRIKVGDTIIQFKQFPFYAGNGLKGVLKFFLTMILSKEILFKTKYVMDMGEGDSFSDIYGKQRFININAPKKTFRFLGKKILLLPQTIGPFNDAKIKKEAKKSIEKSDVVLVRDRMSYDYVTNNTTQKKVKELTDMAFFMPYNKKDFSNGKINVGLNISSLMWHGGYTKNNQFGFKEDYPKLMRAIIEFFLTQANVQIHLISHVVNANSHVENDYEVARFIQDEYASEKITLAPFFLDPIDAKNYISGLDFFTGARMHACIAAFSSGVPVYPIAYSRKFNGLFVETLEYSYLGDLINQNSNEFMTGLEYAFENRIELTEIIQQSKKNIVSHRYTLLIDELSIFLEL
ncbi:polysaccharide pyruvyl transferase family protein [Natronoflexus pectinivorans]|nr:polysaccharide pyruvyl transferase family protein [Natronoflexus pectinivorans]